MTNREYKPTLAQLRTFVTVAEQKHFVSAANKLGISQPSLSQALAALEAGLGIQLIERSTRRVIVTPTGEELLPFAKATLEAADAFVAQSRGALGVLSGPLNIGVIPTIAPYILPTLLKLLEDEYPDLEPRIVENQTEELLQRLRDGQIDVAVLATPTGATGVSEIPLYDETFAVVTSPDNPMAGRKDLDLNALHDLELLLLDDGHCLRDQIVELCKIAEVNRSPGAQSVTRAASLTTVVQLVVAGLGSTLVPVSALSAECERPGIAVATFGPGVDAKRTVGLAMRASSRRRPEFEQLGELITRAFEEATESNRKLLPR
ncbi:LysR family transcriptional regulator [Corynebacterium sp. HMSC05H05]|uniref:hydrogen peroxide-inducible genes activator n=1 Tax=unclassified Corynebacterium TaxID=2624378 RepID=UPI0008A5E36F|nr:MULTISPECIES: hydrogen peroxide-inducible genes activator [unclassified Corynebacterium]OFT58256.1 LysR family transcriptional regulator [Corynebacterium sp. HMSC05H05]OHR19376.1 LysR family transcriptional regulator [Corynebacterium sp. HMSC034A01]